MSKIILLAIISFLIYRIVTRLSLFNQNQGNVHIKPDKQQDFKDGKDVSDGEFKDIK